MTNIKNSQLIPVFRWLTLIGYFGLMTGFYFWYLWIHPLEKNLISIIILFQIGPLIFPLFGLLKGRVYTHTWSMYLAIYYFCVGVWYAGSSAEFYFGLYVICTSLLFFVGTMFYVRLKSKARAANQESA